MTLAFNKIALLACIAAFALFAACDNSARNAAVPESTDSRGAVSKPLRTAAEVVERSGDSLQMPGVPQAVADIGTLGEDLYDQIKISKWANAGALMDKIDRAVRLTADGERGQLSSTLATLIDAIALHQRARAIEAANELTYIAAGLTERYQPKMPADIVRLDYYGRELEILAAQSDMSKIATTLSDLRRTWDAVKPAVIEHGGGAAAAHADGLVAQLESANTPSSVARIANLFLEVVDELEKPFE